MAERTRTDRSRTDSTTRAMRWRRTALLAPAHSGFRFEWVDCGCPRNRRDTVARSPDNVVPEQLAFTLVATLVPFVSEFYALLRPQASLGRIISGPPEASQFKREAAIRKKPRLYFDGSHLYKSVNCGLQKQKRKRTLRWRIPNSSPFWPARREIT